jgi:hypothetical protein
MQVIEYFDYKKLAQEKGITDEELQKIEEEVLKEFLNDKMMFELHMLRVINSGYIPN